MSGCSTRLFLDSNSQGPLRSTEYGVHKTSEPHAVDNIGGLTVMAGCMCTRSPPNKKLRRHVVAVRHTG